MSSTVDDSSWSELKIRLFRALNGISASAEHLTMAELEQAYREVEHKFLSSNLPEPLALEVKRHVAARILGDNMGFEDCDVDWCAERFAELERMGFPGLVQRVGTTLHYCKHMIDCGEKQEAAARLYDLESAIEADTSGAKSQLEAEVHSTISSMLQECSTNPTS